MTNEQLRQNAAAMLAFADGKPIQVGGVDCDPTWFDSGQGDPTWDFRSFSYRPKPEPVTVPWSNATDIPAHCYIRSAISDGLSWSLIVSAGTGGINAIGDAGIHFTEYKDLFMFRYSTDLKTWHKCEVTQ